MPDPQAPATSPTAPAAPLTVRDYVSQTAKALDIPDDLAFAIIDRESGGTHQSGGATTTSPKGAQGFMQLMPGTAKDLGVDPADPLQNITGGLRYFKQQLTTYKGDVRLALAAYNAGPGNVKDRVPDIPETQAYVQDILTRWQQGGAAAQAAPAQAPSAMAAAGASVTPDGDVNMSMQGRPSVPAATPPPAPATDPSVADLSRGPTGSPVARFISEAVTSGVTEPVTGLIALARGMWNDPVGTVEAAAHQMTEPTIRELEAATAARHAGDAEAWTSHMLRAIPLIGPLGAQVGEQMQSGDVAGGLGRLTGAAADYFLPKALGNVKAAKTVGAVPLLRAERAPGPLIGFITNLTERTTPGAGVYKRFRVIQQEALQTEGERIASQISAIPQTATGVGQQVLGMIEQTKDARRGVARQLYSDIDQQVTAQTKRVPVTKEVAAKFGDQMAGKGPTATVQSVEKVPVGGVLPETAPLRKVAIPMLRKLREDTKLLSDPDMATTMQMLTDIVSSPKRVTFGSMQRSRSRLLRIVRKYGDPIPDQAGGAAAVLSGAVDNAMMRAARASGIPGLADRVSEANTLWRETKTLYNAPFLKKIQNASPETVAGLIRGADVEELGLLEKAVPPATYDAARAHIMRDILQDATTPPQTPTAATFSSRFGIAPAGKVPSITSPTLNGSKITTALRNLGYDTSVKLFGKAGVDGLDDLAAVADRVRPGSMNWAATGLIAAGVNASLLAPVLGPLMRPSMFLNPEVLAASTAYSATAGTALYTLSKLLTKPQGLTTYRAFVHSLGTGTRPLVMATSARLAAQLKDLQHEMDDISNAPKPGAPAAPAGAPASAQAATAQPGVAR